MSVSSDYLKLMIDPRLGLPFHQKNGEAIAIQCPSKWLSLKIPPF